MRYIINKLSILLSVLLSLGFFISCEKFLEVQPTDALVGENAIYDAKTARALINSGYSNLKNYSINYGLNLAVLPGDNVFFGGSQSQNIELDNLAFTVTNSAIVGAYAANYSMINIVNWAISEIPKINDLNFNEGEQQKLIGEAHFIRAFAYFNLVKSWGGVQLQLTPTKDLSSLGSIPRSSEADTYKQIFEDLKKAEELLPADDSQTRNRIQKTIVKAFRAKVALYAKNFELAESEAKSVIEASKYSLVKPYQRFFEVPFLSQESVFELSATSNNPGTNNLVWFPASGTPRGSYELRPTNEIITLLNDPSIGGNRNVLLAKRGTNVFVNLYHTTAPNTNPAYIIRLSDLYLISAEAKVRKNNPNLLSAVSDLNAVRSRADASLYPTTGIDSTALLKAIWNERRIEFAFEADRWYDLVRTEQAEEVLGVKRNFWLFPIPQTDILSDPDLNEVNNPGY